MTPENAAARWEARARRAEANIALAVGVINSFDPTSGSGRAGTFVNDLRNCLEAPRPGCVKDLQCVLPGDHEGDCDWGGDERDGD